jgi:hypothetical protein
LSDLPFSENRPTPETAQTLRVPPPRKHRHRYHGVFAPNHKSRSAVTALAIANVGKRRDAAAGGHAVGGHAAGEDAPSEPLEPPPVSPARGPPTDWGELVQVHFRPGNLSGVARRAARDRHPQPLTAFHATVRTARE